MIDARYEERRSIDELTEDSEDELKDLQKEYEFKVQKLLEKKAARKREQQLSKPQIPNSPEKKPKSEETLKNEAERHPPMLNDIVGHEENQVLSEKSVKQIKPNSILTSFVKSLNLTHRQDQDWDRQYEFKIPEKIDLNVSEIEAHSHELLRKRYLAKEQVKSLLTNIKLLKVEKLLAKVVKPHYHEPNYENWVFIGVIMRRSEPQSTKDGRKFLKLSVGSFAHTIDVMLFGKAFDKYWKLRESELIAILNPQVSKFLHPYHGFNLAISNELDSILEIGSISNFGLCSATTRENRKCGRPVDLNKTHLCDFHLDLRHKKSQNQRMVFNGSVQMRSPKANLRSQAVFMDKKGSGFLDFNLANEITTVSLMPSNKNLKKYDKPVDNAKQKKRKLEQQRSNQILEKKLAHLKDHSMVRKLGLIKNIDGSDTKSHGISLAENSEISGMYANSAAAASNSGAADRARREKESLLKSTKVPKSLDTAPDFRKSRIEKYKKARSILLQQAMMERSITQDAMQSDDDLEVEFNEQSWMNYQKLLSK